MLIIREITPEIYQFKFLTGDNLGLHLLRFSDYYEHSHDKFYRNKFSLADSVEMGYENNQDALSWADGINLPVSIIYKMAKEYGSALTTRERFILSAIDTIKADQPALKYIIGTYGDEDDKDEILHELAHGFYYTSEAYRIRMDALIKTLPKRVKDELYKHLKSLNYNQSVWDDELQAYMATGLFKERQEVVNEKLIQMFRSPFVDVFLDALAENDIV